MLVIIHWLTLAIIGVRIYVDNFAVKRNESFRNESEYCSEEPETGEYRSTPFTRYMIFCGFFLPVASTIQNILVMGWFTPLCESIFDRNSLWSAIFVNEPLSYLFAPFLTLSFTGFIVGAFLVDYSTEEYKLLTTVRTTAICLAAFCLFLFTLSNFQAVIIAVLWALVLFLLPMIICNYLCCRDTVYVE